MQLGLHPALEGFQESVKFASAVGILTTCRTEMQQADSVEKMRKVYADTMKKTLLLQLNEHDHQRVSSLATTLMVARAETLGGPSD